MPEFAICEFGRASFERRSHAVVPTIEESEQGDNAKDLHDFSFVPMRLEIGCDHLIDGIGYARRSYGEVERSTLRVAESGLLR